MFLSGKKDKLEYLDHPPPPHPVFSFLVSLPLGAWNLCVQLLSLGSFREVFEALKILFIALLLNYRAWLYCGWTLVFLPNIPCKFGVFFNAYGRNTRHCSSMSFHKCYGRVHCPPRFYPLIHKENTAAFPKRHFSYFHDFCTLRVVFVFGRVCVHTQMPCFAKYYKAFLQTLSNGCSQYEPHRIYSDHEVDWIIAKRQNQIIYELVESLAIGIDGRWI